MLRIALLGLVALVVCTGLAAQPGQPEAEEVQSVLDEFPVYEDDAERGQAAGLRAKHATRALRERSTDPNTIELLAREGRVEEAVGVLERIVARHPDRIAAALRAVFREDNRFFRDHHHHRDLKPLFHALSARIKQRLPSLRREIAAQIARELIRLDLGTIGPAPLDRAQWMAAHHRLVLDYAGTEAALLTEVWILSQPPTTYEKLARLEAFARTHPGTAAAAAALFQKGLSLGSNIAVAGVEPRGSDPTERFMQVLDILRELESVKYPNNDWVERAPTLVLSFYAPDTAKYSSENLDRVLQAYEDFVLARFASERVVDMHNGIGYLLTGRLPRLAAEKGDPLLWVESILTKLESDPRQFAAARYLRGLAYTRNLADGSWMNDAAGKQRAKQILTELSEQGRGSYHRLALATAASLHYIDGEYVAARDLFMRYVAEQRSSPYAWLAAVRAAESDRFLGDRETALDTYRAAANEHRKNAFALVITRTEAGKTLEDLGRFSEALEQYRRALEAWDRDYGAAYSFAPWQSGRRQTTPITRQFLQERIQRLITTTSVAGREQLERGRRALETGDHAQAIAELATFLSQNPTSPALREAQALRDFARWERSLTMLSGASAAPAQRAALAELDALLNEPYSFGVFAATMTKAVLAFVDNQQREAERLMRKAVAEMIAYQRTLVYPPATELEQDVIAIGNEVFRPSRDGVYAGRGGMLDFWAKSSEFLLAPRTLRVTLPDRDIRQVERVAPFPGRDNVLFLKTDEFDALKRILNTLGGTERRIPTGVMEVPNQPIGRARAIADFWNRFFPIRPGHWGGWDLLSDPQITNIEFADAARTRAFASVTVGYTGATVVLEKINGTWVAKELIKFWIT